MIAHRLVIRGRVQGVGYRYAMVEAAIALGVLGWVRNRRDGAVEALIGGSEAAIAAGEISQTIGGVSRAAELASASAAESQRAVEELADMSRQLNCLVTQFKIDDHELAASRAGDRPQSLAAAASK